MYIAWRQAVSVALAVLIIGSTGLLFLAGAASSAVAVSSGFNGKIAFASNRDGNFEIYTMDPDGTNELRITSSPGSDLSPSWSLNGTKIAFARDGEIYVMASRGQNVTKLTSLQMNATDPSWSPDGKSIVFSAITDGTDRDIFVLDVPGKLIREITANNASNDFEPAWSPDGKRIAFTSGVNASEFRIQVMNPDGSGRIVLSGNGSNLHPSWSPDGEKIAYSSNTTKGYDIFVMDKDGGNVTKLTSVTSAESFPSWSPDGEKIVLTSNRAARGDQVHIMYADGTNLQRLTRNQFRDISPEIQPLASPVKEELPILRQNGKIAFTSDKPGNFAEIYTMNFDGTNVTDLISTPDSIDFLPRWSPAGDRIAFVSDRSGLQALVIVNADGSNRKDVTLSTAPITGLGWSPDGDKLVFAKGDPNHRWIHTINADGTGIKRLTTQTEPDDNPSWSPDGTKIAFARDLGFGNVEVYVMDSDGRNQKQITNQEGRDYYPRWSPEGDMIAFVTERSGNAEIYVMAPDGKRLRNLSNHTAADLYPSWSPDGTKIVFVSDRNEDGQDIHIMDADGRNTQRLTSNGGSESDPYFGSSSFRYSPVVIPPEEEEPEVQSINLSAPSARAEYSPVVNGLNPGESLIISTTLTIGEGQTLQASAILQIRDQRGMTQFIAVRDIAAEPSDAVQLEFRWTPDASGTFDLLVLMTDRGTDPSVLGELAKGKVTIVEKA